MSEEYLKSLIDCVSGIEVKSEAEQIAKYELIEYVEELKEQNEKLEQQKKEIIEYLREQSKIEAGQTTDGKMMYYYNLNSDDINGALEILGEDYLN